MTAQASITRRIGIGLVAACATLLTASCAAGQHAMTANETPAIDGISGTVGSIKLAAVAVKAPPVSCYLPGGDAALRLVIVNSGATAETLSGVSSTRFKSALVAASSDDAASYLQAEPGRGSCAPATGSTSAPAVVPPSQPLPAAAGPQKIGPRQSLQLGLSDTGTDTSGEPVVVLRGLTGRPLYAGESIPITFSFAGAGDVTLAVPVQLSVAPNNSIVPPSPSQPPA